MSKMVLITVSYCCDPNIYFFYFFITPQKFGQPYKHSGRATVLLLTSGANDAKRREGSLRSLTPPAEITPCTDTALGCCCPLERADCFLHSYSHVHVWASQTLLSWPVGRMFLRHSLGVNMRSRGATCLILLEGVCGGCRQQPPAGFKNKTGVKCRRSGPAPAVYLRIAEAL